jgi:hypothetical protein
VTPFLWIGALEKLDSETDSRCGGGEEVVVEERGGGFGWGQCGWWISAGRGGSAQGSRLGLGVVGGRG